ncbi:Haloacid dehalogenase [Lasiodiplodia theobromae]|uniref:Haloacid dehalogenase n=1 Tax=Lasiodiplodia theobromae TaxID=45133 RepID=UPI0015C37685|nr:Haloacid dehalogenase [Lasiodiplodia theobromae]KAF4538803.1 Haloacid dehalogenase [Lasiodiplodia theobromae]
MSTTTAPNSAPTPTPKPKPKAIIFDLLTAIIDSWTAWDRAAATALEEESPSSPSSSTPNTPAADPATLGRLWRHNYLILTYNAGQYVPYASLVRDAAAQTPGLPPRTAEHLLANYTAWLAPWPEAADALRRLKAAGYALGVATNCSKELGHGAAGLFDGVVEGKKGAASVFDVVVTAEESGWYKPARGAYAAALERLGVSADEVLFVAGSAADVPGAHAAGMRVVWHNRIGMEAKEGADGMAEKEARTLTDVLEGLVL